MLRTVLPGPNRRATADALDQASRIARAGYVLAGSYSGDETPSNVEVADEIATGTGVHAVLARSVQNPDRHGAAGLAGSTVAAGAAARPATPDGPGSADERPRRDMRILRA